MIKKSNSLYSIGAIICSFLLLSTNVSLISGNSQQLPEYKTTFNGSILFVGGSGPGNYSTIQQAIDNANENDTIFVYNGVYNEFIIIEKQITLIGEQEENTIIDAENNHTVVTIGNGMVNVSNFTIQNGNNNGIYIDNAHGATIRDVTIQNCEQYGLYGSSAIDCTIDDTMVYNNKHGIYLDHYSRNCSITSNNIASQQMIGLSVENSYELIIHSNLISNNSYGLKIYSCNNSIITNNSILNHPHYGILIKQNSYQNTISFNDIFYNENGIELSGQSSENNLTANTIKTHAMVPPIAIDDSASTLSNTSVLIPVYENDFDRDGIVNHSTIQINQNPSHGTLFVNSSGEIQYTPNTGFNGNDTFSYQIRDNTNLLSNTATVHIHVINDSLGDEIGQQQTVLDRYLSVYSGWWMAQLIRPQAGTLTRISLQLKKIGNPPAPLQIDIHKNSLDGPVIFSSTCLPSSVNNSYSWIPFDDTEVTTESNIQYYIVAHTTSGNVNNCYHWGHSTTSVYPQGRALSSTDFGSTWTPLNNSDFCFKIFKKSGIGPVSANDSYAINHENTLTISAPGILDNDHDYDLGPQSLAARLISDVSHGTLSFNSDGSFTYDADWDFYGIDSFTYKATDGKYNSSISTVTINVTTTDKYCIYIPYSGAGSTNNQIYHNNFLSGSINPFVFDSYDNNWDNTTISSKGGNYWTNYNEPSEGAIDIDNNGIYDTSYPIDTAHQDHYPLSNPYVSYLPSANFTWTPYGPDTDLRIKFTDTSIDPGYGSITEWYWQFGDGNTSNEQHPLHQYDTIGIYNATLKVTDDDGFVDSISKPVTVAANPPTADFTWTPTNPETFQEINFIDLSTDDGDIVSWIWDFDDGNTSTQQHPTHVYADDGNYTVHLEVGDDDGAIDTISKQISVLNRRPQAEDDFSNTFENTPVLIDVLQNDTDMDGFILPSSVTINTPAIHGNTTVNTSSGNILYSPEANFYGEDSFSYEITDDDGATDTANVFVTVTHINQIPIAENDSYVVNEEQNLSVSEPGVLFNDTDPDNYPGTLSSVLISSTTYGDLSLHNNGSFVYQPYVNFTGVDSFIYQAYDGMNYSLNATVSIIVQNTNDAPVAIDDYYTPIEDTVFNNHSLSVLDNDIDADNSSAELTAELVENTTHGTLQFNENGSFTYNPDPNFSGIDTFTYQAFDGLNYSNEATVTLSVQNVNDPPVAINDSYNTSENTQLIVDSPGVLGNDYDVDDGDELTALRILGPYHGTLNFYGDGSFDYMPNTDFHGYDSFSYQAFDGTAGSNIANVTIFVNDTNEPPIANNDSYTVIEDTWLNMSSPGVLQNDTDPDDSPQPLTCEIKTNASHGFLQLNADGSFSYLSNENYTGFDTFSYLAFDGENYSQPATVTISISNVNDAPVAVNNLYTIDEDTTLFVQAPGVLSNDYDAESAVANLTAMLTSNVSVGNLSFFTNGSFTYQPDPNYFGIVNFTYQAFDGMLYSNNATVKIIVNSVNDIPVALNESYLTSKNATVHIPGPGILDNDVDPDDYPENLTAVLVNDSKGSLNLSPNGSFVYTPLPGFVGKDSFTYFAYDGMNYSNETMVNITVLDSNIPPIAVNDSYYTERNTNLSVSSPGVLTNDLDVDTSIENLTSILISGVSNGTLTLHTNGSFQYIPELNFTGSVTFTYQAFDGENYSSTATVNITIVSQLLPVAHNDSFATLENNELFVDAPGILANDTGGIGSLTSVLIMNVSNGFLQLNENGSFYYNPMDNWTGIDVFTYQAFDDQSYSSTATVTITVVPSNQPPVANDDSYDALQNNWLHIPAPGVLFNDFDPDLTPQPITAVLQTNVSHGYLSLNNNGSFSYLPHTNFTGFDSFTYKAFDGINYSTTATVSITVGSGNQAPIAQNDTYATMEDTILSVNLTNGLLANDSDPDNGPHILTSVLVDSPSFGEVMLNASGSFTYYPDENVSGIDTFTYQAFDGQSYSNLTTVTILVNSVNDAPVAVNDNVQTVVNLSIDINVISNDFDVDGLLNLSSVTITSMVSNGSLTNNGDGTISYTPNAGFVGVDEFNYTVMDNQGLISNEAVVTITVVPDVIDVNQSVFDRGFPIRMAVDGSWAGAQSFMPTMQNLSRAELYVRSFGNPTFNLSVELRENSVNGTLLDTVTFTPSEISNTWSWVTVDFADTSLNVGNTYFIVIPSAPTDVTNSFGYEWGYAFDNQYDDGSFWFTRDGGNLWRDLPSSYEFSFQTFAVVEY